MEERAGADLVRRWFDAFNRRDLAATLALAHPEIAFSPLQVHGSGTWHGHAGVEELWAEMRRVGLDHRIEITRVHVLPDGRLAALGLVKPGDVLFAGLYRVEQGLVREAQHRFGGEETLRRLAIPDEPG